MRRWLFPFSWTRARQAKRFDLPAFNAPLGSCPRDLRGLSAILLALFGLCLAAAVSEAALPPRTYRATSLPGEIAGNGYRIDDNGNVFTVSSLPAPGRKSTTKFFIYRPASDGTQPAGVQTIPGPITPAMGQYDLIDINQRGQFVCSENSLFDDHRFLWNGSQFVELRPLPPNDVPAKIFEPLILYSSDHLHPTSINDDGTVCGISDIVAGINDTDFGGEVRWDIQGISTLMFRFRSANDPLRFGLGRNERGRFLRYNSAGNITNATFWSGQSETLGFSITHPPTSAIRLNDHSDVAGIVADTREIWLYVPQASYGLTAGYHLLSGVKAKQSAPAFVLNNRGEIIVSTDDPAQPLAVWNNNVWWAARVLDTNNNVLAITGGILDSNAKGQMTTAGLVLTPLEQLTVTSLVSPARMEIGDTFDLQLDIRNDTLAPLNKVGILVSSLRFSGAVVGDWIKAPPSLLTLAPGATGTLHYGFRAKASGKAQLRFQVEGFNADGQQQALTATLLSPLFQVLPPEKGDLLVKRSADASSSFAQNDVYQTIPTGAQVLTNNTTANTAAQFQIQIQNDGTNSAAFHLNAIESGADGWDIKYFSDTQDISTGLRTVLGVEFPTLAPKQGYLVDVRMTPTNAPVGSIARSQLFLSITNSAGGLETLDAVEAVGQRVDAVGDLLVRRIIEPPSAFGLDDVYQEKPAGAQIRTNIVDQNVLSEFELQIQNDSRIPEAFRLIVSETDNLGWKPVTYLFAGSDIGPQLRAPAGYDFPVLGTNKSYLLRVQMTPTNATPGSQFRASFALSTTNNPSVILDAAELVTEIPFEIIVNSTGDLPLDPSVECCCDTGRKLTDGVTAECTLRAAIEIANKHEGKDTIKFKIPHDDPNFGNGVPRIEPLEGLPPIKQPAKIDGWSQNTTASKPPIELAGDRLPLGHVPPVSLNGPPDNFPTSLTVYSGGISGLVVEAGNSEIQGLVINRFPFCGIELGGGDNVVQRSYVGTDAEGKYAKANGRFGYATERGWYDVRGCGILVRSPGNIIGGAGNGNLLSGIHGSRARAGDLLGAPEVGAGVGMPPDIAIVGEDARGNVIEGNLIGTTFDGLKLI